MFFARGARNVTAKTVPVSHGGLQFFFVLVHQIVGPLEDIGHGVILVGIEFRHAGGDNDAGSGVDMGEGSAANLLQEDFPALIIVAGHDYGEFVASSASDQSRLSF